MKTTGTVSARDSRARARSREPKGNDEHNKIKNNGTPYFKAGSKESQFIEK
jgi:hypothetical protein